MDQNLPTNQICLKNGLRALAADFDSILKKNNNLF